MGFKIIRTIKFTISKFISKILFENNPDFKKLINLPEFEIVSNSIIESNVKLYPNCKIYNSKIGSYSYVSDNCVIKETTIGKFCSIGPNLVCGWGIHPKDKLSTSPMFYSTLKQNGISLVDENHFVEQKQIFIGNDVFIGMNVTILDGVSIGDGAIIGAGSVVSKDIPAYSIAVGSPIKVISKRFNDETIDELIKIKWWEWNFEDLKFVKDYFNNTEQFVKKFKINEVK